MTDTPRFADLLATVRGAGFDVSDMRGLPVDEEHQPYLEDENLMMAPARLVFHTPEGETQNGVIADVTVRQHLFEIRGEWHRQDELRHVLSGKRAPEAREPEV